MFRIRRIHDDVLPVNRSALDEVRGIFQTRFSDAPQEDASALGERLRNPFRKRFRTIVYVAENSRHRVVGFAIVLHEPEIGFCYLDYLAADKKVPGRGVGAAIYEYVRDEALAVAPAGLFFECLPDVAERCADSKTRQVNAARLKFYEQYGARPIVGTAYETPAPGCADDNLPHLVWDGLDRETPLRARLLRQVIRAVLERKYSDLCPPEYVDAVVASVREDPIRLREPRYDISPLHKPARPARERLVVVMNDQHDIHHVRERGYVEAPARVNAILNELRRDDMLESLPARRYSSRHIREVHDADFVDYLRRACENAPEGKSVYPYVFPIRNAARPPRELTVRAGYYCIDTFTPINRNAFPAARRAVDCVLTAADAILEGRRVAYALVRPPDITRSGGRSEAFAISATPPLGANYLSFHGTVAIVDVDYHHGNGQQDIFYDRRDVLTVSLHGDPDFAYPYFTGFADERGTGAGEGFNVNLPLPESQDGPHYREALSRALEIVRGFAPRFLVIALGLDPAKGDPTGTWSLGPRDFQANGQLFSELRLPTLVVQEGGYRTRTLGNNARHFFQGLLGWSVSRGK